MNIDEIAYSLKNLKNRKMRSWLTVLSILIGVMAIFAIVSFGLGIKNYTETLAQEAGVDKLFIQARSLGAPGTDDTFFISKKDIDFVEKINGVKTISGMYMRPVQLEFRDEEKWNYFMGLDIDKIDFILESFTVEITEGRQLDDGELGKVTLGYNYQFENKIFERAVRIGDKVAVGETELEVVGFYDQVGNAQDDGNIYVSKKQYELMYPGSKDKYGYVMLQAEEGIDPDELSEKIEDKLRKFKDQEEGQEDFYVQTFADAIEIFNSVFNILLGMLALIALVSMLVASVNIMNTMYTAVLERKKEIGIMKAIGARNNDILFVFIFESGVLGMVGGIIGVIAGYAVSTTGGAIAAAAGYSMLKPIFPVYLTLLSIAFAFFTGAIAGVLPAMQAAKQNPVDALRENE